MAEEKKQETIPAGSMPPKVDEGKSEESKAAENTVSAEELKGAQEKVAKMETELANLKKVHGQHTNEVGTLRQDKEAMLEQMAGMQTTIDAIKSANATPAENIYREIEDGTLGMAEGLRMLQEANDARLANAVQQTRDETLGLATKEFQKTLSERDGATVREQFFKDNPDFMALQESGALEGIKRQNPLHDDFSAYYELRATQAYEKGKADLAKAEKGVAASEKVLTKPGGAIRQVNKSNKPLTDLETKQSGLAALERLRAE